MGRYIFEDSSLRGRLDALDRHDVLLTASNWNAGLLRAHTGRDAKIIFEGGDTTLFCPGPRTGLLDPQRFYVFSGGKIEFRKAQDLVIRAFSRFAQTRPDAVLVTAWHSPWPRMAAGFKGSLEHALELMPNGMLNLIKWVKDNGISSEQFIDLGPMRNPTVPLVLREMDVALQPSRAEACTNLPVKEAMACCVPVIAAPNTGMLDLLTADNSILLTRQTSVPGDACATEGWGESDVDEMVAALEFAYTQREAAREIGSRARQHLIDQRRTWRDHAEQLQAWLLSL